MNGCGSRSGRTWRAAMAGACRLAALLLLAATQAPAQPLAPRQQTLGITTVGTNAYPNGGMRVLRQVPMGPNSIANYTVDPEKQLLYHGSSTGVAVVDLVAEMQIDTIPVPGGSLGVVFDPHRQVLYAGDDGLPPHRILRIDPASGLVTGEAPLLDSDGGTMHRGFLDPAGQRLLFQACDDRGREGTKLFIDVPSLTRLGRFGGGTGYLYGTGFSHDAIYCGMSLAVTSYDTSTTLPLGETDDYHPSLGSTSVLPISRLSRVFVSEGSGWFLDYSDIISYDLTLTETPRLELRLDLEDARHLIELEEMDEMIVVSTRLWSDRGAIVRRVGLSDFSTSMIGEWSPISFIGEGIQWHGHLLYLRGLMGGNWNFAQLAVTQRGVLKATRTELVESAASSEMHFYSHGGPGRAQLILYRQDSEGGPCSLRWRSKILDLPVAEGWVTAAVREGVPSRLELEPGVYWLAWQIDTYRNMPSQILGKEGTGFCSVQPFGNPPAVIKPVEQIATDENWSQYMNLVQPAEEGWAITGK